MEMLQIKEKITDFLVEELEIEEGKINEDARLKEDLGIDSLEVVDVIVLVDREFGFRMQAEDFKTIKTFGQFCKFVEEHSNS